MNAEAIAALLRTHLADQFGWMSDGLRGEIARKVAPLLADDLAALLADPASVVDIGPRGFI